MEEKLGKLYTVQAKCVIRGGSLCHELAFHDYGLASCSMLHATYVSHFITCVTNVIHLGVLTLDRVRTSRTYTFVTYAQTSYIITNRGEAFLARRREDLFLVCVCFYETFQSVHQIICELFSY